MVCLKKKRERERRGEEEKKKKNLGEKYQQLTLFGCFVSFPRRLEPLSLPQLRLAAGVSWSLTWMASETTQSSPWLELISYVQLKNPMHTHTSAASPRVSFWFPFCASFPRYNFLSEAERAAMPPRPPSRREALPQRGAEPGEARLLDVRQASRRVKNGQCWTTINVDYDFFFMKGKKRIVIWYWHLTGTRGLIPIPCLTADFL